MFKSAFAHITNLKRLGKMGNYRLKRLKSNFLSRLLINISNVMKLPNLKHFLAKDMALM